MHNFNVATGASQLEEFRVLRHGTFVSSIAASLHTLHVWSEATIAAHTALTLVGS
jgi:hypothetical protein